MAGALRPSPVDSISFRLFSDRTSCPVSCCSPPLPFSSPPRRSPSPPPSAASASISPASTGPRSPATASIIMRTAPGERPTRSPPIAQASAPSSPPPCWSNSAIMRSSPARRAAIRPPAQRAADRRYYAAYLDRAAIDQRGVAPLQPHLQRIAAIWDRQAIVRRPGHLDAGRRRSAERDQFPSLNGGACRRGHGLRRAVDRRRE